MRKLAALTFTTLDGVMQAPMSPDEDTSEGFDQGGWAAKYYEAVMPQVQQEAMSEPYDILFGRKTYDAFASHWSTVDPQMPVARMMNNATKYIATTATTELNWSNSHRLTGDITSAVGQLKAQRGPLLQIHGSWQLIQTLLDNQLIDEFRIWTFPVTVGRGKRLFESHTPLNTLQLVKSQANSNGVVMSIYSRN